MELILRAVFLYKVETLFKKKYLLGAILDFREAYCFKVPAKFLTSFIVPLISYVH